MKRTVSIGTQDFEKIRAGNCFYIDKTDYIRQWWDSSELQLQKSQIGYLRRDVAPEDERATQPERTTGTIIPVRLVLHFLFWRYYFFPVALPEAGRQAKELPL